MSLQIIRYTTYTKKSAQNELCVSFFPALNDVSFLEKCGGCIIEVLFGGFGGLFHFLEGMLVIFVLQGHI